MTDDRVRPFYCGTQGADWRTWNCENCYKHDSSGDAASCPIERALDEAYWSDGTVSAEIAQRMGNQGTCTEQAAILSHEEWGKRLAGPPTRLMPLWKRLRFAAEAAHNFWIPIWRPQEDIYGVPGRISLRLACELAWGIWRDARERLK